MRRLDGSPARGAHVILRGEGPPAPSRYIVHAKGWSVSARTGKDGIARYEGIPEGSAEVSVWEAGYVSGPDVPVVLRDGETVRCRVDEVPGRTVVVRVEDRDGRPLPGALVEVSGAGLYSPVDIEGRQSDNLVTNAGGLVLLPRVPAGALSLRVTHGDRSGHAFAESDRVTIPLD